jgi:hypothetical protein
MNGQKLKEGDGAAVSSEKELDFACAHGQLSEFLLFDLP